MTSTQRAAAVYVLRKAGLSYPKIGRRLGICHTTALAAQRRAERLIKYDVDFEMMVDDMRAAASPTDKSDAKGT